MNLLCAHVFSGADGSQRCAVGFMVFETKNKLVGFWTVRKPMAMDD